METFHEKLNFVNDLHRKYLQEGGIQSLAQLAHSSYIMDSYSLNSCGEHQLDRIRFYLECYIQTELASKFEQSQSEQK